MLTELRVIGESDHWLIELEYSDEVTPAMVARFFERITPVLPAEVGSNLEWVVRSPQHDEVAREMERLQLPFSDRVGRWSDLVPEGTVDVYSEGVAAGRLLYVGDDGAELGDATAGDIIITERVPDWLPQASALYESIHTTHCGARADEALYNASVLANRAGDTARALALRTELRRAYPQSALNARP